MKLPAALVFVASLAGSWYYIQFANRRGIVAKTNFRTLHEKVVPRGGGIVFAVAFVLAATGMWTIGAVPTPFLIAFALAGGAAATVGFIDDVRDIRARTKLFAQICLSVAVVVALYQTLSAVADRPGAVPLTPNLIPFAVFIPLWMINLYNFTDGIDGLAITGAVYICLAALLVLQLTNGDPTLILIIGLLAASCAGFVPVNIPPARAFMGDAGSMFFGCCLGALILVTVASGQITSWTWLAIMGYYIGDTTTTTLSRMVLVKRWHGGHRSHAYQNLARILGSHARVTYGVLLYNLLFALPLAVWSALRPNYAPVAATLSLGPVVLWTLRFGPRLSSD